MYCGRNKSRGTARRRVVRRRSGSTDTVRATAERLPHSAMALEHLLMLMVACVCFRSAVGADHSSSTPVPPAYTPEDYDVPCAELMQRFDASEATADELWPPAFGLPEHVTGLQLFCSLMLEILRRILAVLKLRAFFSIWPIFFGTAGNWSASGGFQGHYWGRRPLWVRRRGGSLSGGVYGKLLNLAELERAIAENPAAMLYGHGIKFARGGKVAQLGERTIDAATARDGFHKRSATVVINEFERIHQPTMALAEVRRPLFGCSNFSFLIRVWTQAIEAEFGMYVSSNLYATPPSARYGRSSINQ